MRSYVMLLKAVAALAGFASAAPYHMQHRVMVPQQYYEILALRAATNVNPDAVTGVTCLDAKQYGSPPPLSSHIPAACRTD